MQIHLMLQGRRTSISVSDQLVGYLADRLCKDDAFTRTVGWRKATHDWIQKTVNRAGVSMPTKGVSQWVSARIVDAIVDPEILALKEQRVSVQTMAKNMGMPTR